MTKKRLTSSEYEEMVSTGKANHMANTNYVKYGIIIIVTLVLCGVSFGAGISYQKGKQLVTSAAATTNDSGQFSAEGGELGGRGSLRSGQRPNIGEVKAVTSDSITISSQQSESDQTFKITSSTVVQNNGSTASLSDIKTGNTVLIRTDSSDTTKATQITLNPGFGSPGGGSTQSSLTWPETEISTQSV